MKSWIEKGLKDANYTMDENGIKTLKGEELERVKERWEYYEKKERRFNTAIIAVLGIIGMLICVFSIYNW